MFSINMTAMLNCPMLCATPPPTLIPTDENPLIFFKISITIRLRIPPARLYAIVIGFPNRKPASTTRITEISRVLVFQLVLGSILLYRIQRGLMLRTLHPLLIFWLTYILFLLLFSISSDVYCVTPSNSCSLPSSD